MSFLISGVFGYEMKIFAADDEGSMHFCRDDGAGENTTTDGDETGEGTFLI